MKHEHDDAKAVGIWIRVSTEDQVRGESPEHHEKRARAYAEARGWEVVDSLLPRRLATKPTLWTPTPPQAPARRVRPRPSRTAPTSAATAST